MSRLLLLSALLLAALPLAGCLSGPSDSFDFDPAAEVSPSGRTIHLKATVVDYDLEPYPGLKTYLWAFCFAPFDANDEVSKNAIEAYTPLPTDVPVGAPEGFTCSVPGPTLRVQQGDRVIVEFTHTHFHPHTIHWHGQYVPWESDGAQGTTQDAVESGGAFTYDFIAKRAGTLWYHCHVDTATHVMQGLYGMMIVEPRSKKYEPKDIDHEETIILSTMNRGAVEAVGARHSHPPGCASGFPNCQNPISLAGKPDVYLWNGHSYPYTMDQAESVVQIAPGERIRIRVLNAGETFEELHLHGHDMQVVAQDGNPLSPSARYWVDTLPIGPAQRFDVVVEGTNPGPWLFHTHVDSHAANCDKFPGGMHSMMLYPGFEDKAHAFKAELPATCPFGSVPSLPGDLVDGKTFTFDSNQAPSPLPPVSGPTEVEDAFSWPIELPCAVQKMTVRATLRSAGALAGQNSLDATITDNAGGTAEGGTFTLTPGSPTWTFVIEKNDLSKIPAATGNYTFALAGTVVDAQVDVDVVVDYYESFEESKVGHLAYKTSGCPGYT